MREFIAKRQGGEAEGNSGLSKTKNRMRLMETTD